MRTWYRDWMHNWERRLALEDTNRTIHPFEWGLEWLDPDWADPLPDSPLNTLKAHASRVLAHSDAWFAPPEIKGVDYRDNILTFQTPTPASVEENNLVRCRFYPAKGTNSAVIVVPQWNAGSDSHTGLCRLLNRMGISSIRMTQPYHEDRNIPKAERADYMLGPNIGRTLHATRQSVLEVRQVFNWLKMQGFTKIGIIGTSLGSCVSYLAFVHETGFTAGVFNHASSFYGDVVWRGMATRYVRAGLEGNISAQDLKKCWAPLSPWHYIHRLKENYRPHLLINAAYDLTFLPRNYKSMLAKYRRQNIPSRTVSLPCGHYTLGKFPFVHLDGWHISSFLKQQLN